MCSLLVCQLPSVNESPTLRDLCHYVTPCFASQWKVIGIQLGLTQERINIIEEDNRKCEKQCNEMLSYWLQCKVDNITWKELLAILEFIDDAHTDHGTDNIYTYHS